MAKVNRIGKMLTLSLLSYNYFIIIYKFDMLITDCLTVPLIFGTDGVNGNSGRGGGGREDENPHRITQL